LEGEQERRRTLEEEEGTRGRSSETGAKTEFAMTLSMAEEANVFSAGNNRACSDRRSRENEYSGSKGVRTENGSSNKKGSLCYGSRSGEELLCLWGIWAYGLTLQKLGTEREVAEGRRLSMGEEREILNI